MRRSAGALAVLVLALAAAEPLGAPTAAAQGDPRKEALLLYVEGKFEEAEALLAKAGPEVVGDAALRAQLADAALRSLRNKQGEDRRPALAAMRRCWAAVAEKQPGDPAAVGGAISAARDLAALDLAAKQPKGVRAQAEFAIGIGEKAPPEALDAAASLALSEAYVLRAAAVRSPDTVDLACADYDRAAQTAEAALAKKGNEADCLARAARAKLEAAKFVRDTIPIETETRDEAYLRSALDLATRACEAKGATEPVFATQSAAVLTAHWWKLPDAAPRIFAQPLAPPLEGLKIEVPRGGAWKVGTPTDDWDVILDRKLEDEWNVTVQAMFAARAAKATLGGKAWAQIEEAVETRYESCLASFTEGTNADTKPTRLGGKKSELWYFEVGGMRPDLKRPQRILGFVWPSTTRKETVWEVRVTDWRRPSSIDDPDIAAVVASAIGPGHWPPGAAPKEEPPAPKKKPGGTKKK